MAKFTWKVWLRNNKLTPDPNDYVAEVDTAGETRRVDDIVNHIINEGYDIKPEIIRAVIERSNLVKRDYLLNGYSVYDDFVQLTPRITGSWTGTETFTEGKHRVTVDAVLSKAMHEELKHVGVQLLGVAGSKARIMLVTDVATGKTDGTITKGDDIVIVGDKIKLLGEPQPNGSMEPGIDVYFVDIDSRMAVSAFRISENTPSKLMVRVPSSLMKGEYTLRIVTRYTSGSILLKEPRTIEYEHPLVVK